MESAPSAQCSTKSSVRVTSYSLLWSNLHRSPLAITLLESSRLNLRARGGGESDRMRGGTTVVGVGVSSSGDQKLYWQNTKWEREGGRPDACFMVI